MVVESRHRQRFDVAEEYVWTHDCHMTFTMTRVPTIECITISSVRCTLEEHSLEMVDSKIALHCVLRHSLMKPSLEGICSSPITIRSSSRICTRMFVRRFVWEWGTGQKDVLWDWMRKTRCLLVCIDQIPSMVISQMKTCRPHRSRYHATHLNELVTYRQGWLATFHRDASQTSGNSGFVGLS